MLIVKLNKIRFLGNKLEHEIKCIFIILVVYQSCFFFQLKPFFEK